MSSEASIVAGKRLGGGCLIAAGATTRRDESRGMEVKNS